MNPRKDAAKLNLYYIALELLLSALPNSNPPNSIEVLAALKSLSGDCSSAMSAEGAVTLVFDGYDNDPREIEAIPEVRALNRTQGGK